MLLNTGPNPTGTACTKNKIYIANNNNYGIPGQDSVTVVKNNAVLTTIYDASFSEPYTVTINSKYIYVTNSNSSTITIIKNDLVVGVLDGFDGPCGMTICNNIGYVINYGGPILGSGNGHTISVVNLRTRMIVDTIDVALAPAAIKISRGNLYVISYVDGNPGTGVISVINIKTKNINYISGLSGPFDIAITPCGKKALVTNFGSNNFSPYGTTVSIINLKKLVIVKNINVGIQPSGVCISPCGKFAYVTNYNTLYAGPSYTNLTPGQGTVSVIDVEKKKVLYNITVNQAPSNICCSQDGKFIYVTNFISNTLNIVKTN